ncbi:MAG: PKD domain-containing protein, partial [Thermoanaerobaculia bacterium]
GYVRVTPAIGNQGGSMYRVEKLLYNNFRMIATVELRDGSIGRPADGMCINIIGGDAAPTTPGNLGGGMGAPYGLGRPQMTFAFDNWSCNVSDRGDDNHVAFAYAANGFPMTDDVPYQAFAVVARPFLLNNREPPPSSANRFLFQVQVKNSLVTCDLTNDDAGMPKTRMFTYRIPDFAPFEGFLGVTASTGGAWQNHILHGVQIQDITGFCLLPPATVLRNITNETRTDKLPVYNQGDVLKIELAVSDLRTAQPEEDCAPPSELTITETLPAGWAAEAVSDGGTYAAGVVTWVLKGADVRVRTLSYKTTAATNDFRAVFTGVMKETNVPGIDPYGVAGDVSAILDMPFSSGFITQWLLLGPYSHVGFDSPGPINLRRDYLTDGAGVDEQSVIPKDGDTVNTSFTASGSTGYANAAFSTPTWQSHANSDDVNLDTVDLNAIFASGLTLDPNHTMAYAVAYVENTTGAPLGANLEVASDDSIQVLLNRCEVHLNSIPRGFGVSGEVQDTAPVTLEPGINRLLIKVFEGAGGWGFRARFFDSALSVPFEPPTIRTSLAPGAFALPDVGCPVPIISSSVPVGRAPLEMRFSGARSLARAGRAITTYEWVFGDGQTGTGAEAAHTYAAAGVYTVELRVTDAGGSTATAERDVHVLGGGIVLAADGMDALVLQGAAAFLDTADGYKTYHSPSGDEVAVLSNGDFAVEVTALPAGVTEVPVAVLLRNVAEHGTGLTIAQRTPGAGTSSVGFGMASNTVPPNILARDNLGNEDPTVSDAVLRTQDGTLADAYAPFAYAQSDNAKLKVGAGINFLRLDNRAPPQGVSDNGNQVAAVVIGADVAGFEGRVADCPVQPGGLTAKADPTFCLIALDWNDNPGRVDSYNVYRATAAAGPYDKNASTGESAYADSGPLAKNTPYYYKVSAVLGGCESPQTSQRFARTGANCSEPQPPPDAPTELVATGGTKQVSLSWKAPAGGTPPTAYVVRRGAAPGGPYADVGEVAAPQTAFTDTGLLADTSYCYVVRSKAATILGGTSNEDCDKTRPDVVGVPFRRGDVNADGKLDVSDPVKLLGFLFLGQGRPECLDAGDTDDSGVTDISDAVSNLGFQFLGAAEPANPGPRTCGPDPTPDIGQDLGCDVGC